MITLPHQADLESLGDSHEIAIKIFYNLELKLNRNEDIRNEYSSFMYDYLALGHMKLIDEGKDNDRKVFYLPCLKKVFEESSTTSS